MSIITKSKALSMINGFFSLLAVMGLCADLALAKPAIDSSLYTVTIPAQTQQVQERNRLIQAAFQTVLLRLSSSAECLKSPDVQQALQQVDPFVSQFTFEGFGDHATQGKALKVVFNAATLNQFLKKLGYPLWNTPRQNTLVWIALDQGEQRTWLRPESEPPIWKNFTQALGERAVPVVSPLFDLLDVSEFPVEAIWDHQFDAVLPTLKRYGAPLCVLGLVRELPGGWHAEWFLFSEAQALPLTQWETTALETEALLQDSLASLGGFLAKTDLKAVAQTKTPIAAPEEAVASKASPQQETQLAIAGIKNSAQYAKVLGYLKRITDTETQVDILGIEPEYTLFRLRPAVTLDILRRKVQQDALLFERYDTVAADNPSTLYLDFIEVDKL